MGTLPTSPKQPTPSNRYHDDPDANGASLDQQYSASSIAPLSHTAVAPTFRVYKRRFYGLVQLILLNIVVSWSWLTYAPVSNTASEFFDVSVSSVNWLSTAFLFAFCAATPATIYVLNKHGPKGAIVCSAVLIFVGSWIRYGGTRSTTQRGFSVVMFGQILVGFGQPFVLSAPTRYSDVWFSEKGRIAATAVTSLANPLGGAVSPSLTYLLEPVCVLTPTKLGQLISPFWATKPTEIPSLTLYVAIISTIAAAPSFFIPSAPPTPPTPTSSLTSHPLNLTVLRRLAANPSFWILVIPFWLLVTNFNAISSELNSVLYPYGFSETSAGIAGALLILVGLVAAAIMSPILDAYTTPSSSARIWLIKVLVIVTAVMYLAFVFAPATRSDGAPYAISAIMGAASFMLVPLALELLVEVTWEDAGPEVSSAVCWAGGQLGGAVTIVIMDSLRGAWGGEPAGNMKGGLVFLAVLACLAVPLPMGLGWRGWGRAERHEAARRERDGDRGGGV